MLALTEQMKSDGLVPWCVSIESGAATGWIIADWIMDMVLQMYGEDVYNEWLRGDIPNTDPRIKAAWEEAGKILNDPDAVYGGVAFMLTNPWDRQALPMFDEPPLCGMTHYASFTLSSLPSDVVADLDNKLGMFLFPKFDPDATEATVGNSTFTGVLVDSPEARELAKWLSTEEAFQAWIAESPYALSYNNKVPLEAYSSQVQKDLASAIGGGVPVVVENAVDSFPGAVAQAYWSNLTQWVEDGGANIDDRLAAIDAAWEQ
jgi:alpha-glucoside transport system substrate-binding protein